MENYLPKTMDFYLPKSMDFSLPFTQFWSGRVQVLYIPGFFDIARYRSCFSSFSFIIKARIHVPMQA
jgi:hypothetical protein